MCQQTRIAAVIPYYQKWMQAFPNWSRLARAPKSQILRMWEGLGYYRRACFLHSLARAVIRLPAKDLPPEPDALRQLPGIGDYTAGAIASIAFGKPAPAFDGNVARVLGRLAARRGKSSALPALRTLAGKLVPQKNPGLHNQALMELGALVCLPQNPRCPACPMQRACPSSSRLPLVPSRKPGAPTAEREYVLLPKRNGKVWLTREHPAGRWKNLFLLPTLLRAPGGTPILSLGYPYTRFWVQASVFVSRCPPANFSGRWMTAAEVRRVAVPAPHRKILVRLGIS
jgi:A/G-specific adenine glycosylase